jgi:hypothetical protein
MGVKGVWILQKGLYEGTETCWKVLCVCVYLLHFANMRDNKNYCLATSVNNS